MLILSDLGGDHKSLPISLGQIPLVTGEICLVTR